MLSAVTLSAAMLNAVYAVSYFYCYAECHYDESHNDECLSAECHYDQCCGSMKMGMNSIFYMSVKKSTLGRKFK